MSNGTVVRRSVPSSPLRRVYASAVPTTSSSSRTVASSRSTPRSIASGPGKSRVPAPTQQEKNKPRRTLFRVDRFEDMKVLGYE
jgi:hypothetical protein